MRRTNGPGRLASLGRAAMLTMAMGVAAALGTVGAVLAFFFAARFTASVALLAGAGAATLALLTWALAALGCRWLIPHGRPARRVLPVAAALATLTVIALASAALVFEPMDVQYVPMEPTQGVRYWELSTGSRIAYLVVQAQDTRASRTSPVVVLHGGPGAPSPLVPRREDELLSAHGFDVYHYHQVGAGLSGRLDDVREYTVQRHVADLEAIRQEIGAERIILVGGSWGGTLAAHYIAAHPERVERVVFASPGAIWQWGTSWTEGAGSAGPEVDIITEAATPRFGVAYYLKRVNPRAAHNLAPDEEMSGFMQPLLAEIIALDMGGCPAEEHPDERANPGPIIPAGFSYYVSMLTAASMDLVKDPRPALREVDVPALIVRGACDRIRWEVHAEYRETFRNSTLVTVEDAAHSVAGSPLYPELLRAFLLGEPLPVEPDEGPLSGPR